MIEGRLLLGEQWISVPELLLEALSRTIDYCAPANTV